MSIKEKLHQKIDTMTEANLEWLNGILEIEEYPDVRVQRSAEEMDEIRSLLKELSAPMTIEQKTAFNEAMQ